MAGRTKGITQTCQQLHSWVHKSKARIDPRKKEALHTSHIELLRLYKQKARKCCVNYRIRWILNRNPFFDVRCANILRVDHFQADASGNQVAEPTNVLVDESKRTRYSILITWMSHVYRAISSLNMISTSIKTTKSGKVSNKKISVGVAFEGSVPFHFCM